MAFDLAAFLKELGPTAEEEAILTKALGTPERLTLLEKNQLRQSDYSKMSDGLSKEQKKLTEAQGRLDAEAAEWAKLTATEQEAATALRDSLNKTEQKVLALTQRVTKIATDAGLDPAKALEGIDQAPPKKEEPKVDPIDTSKFVGAEQFGSMSEYLFNLSVELPMIAAEHLELTGERLDTRALRAEIQKRATTKGANLDPRAIWEETNKIPEKRDAKTATTRAAEITAAEGRGFERARSEAALPIPPSNGQHSPMLRVNGEKHDSILKRPVPESGVRAAAQALATGKYRQVPVGAAK